MPQTFKRLACLLAVLGGLAFAAVAPYLGEDRGFLANHPAAINPWSEYAPQAVLDQPINTNAGDKQIIVIPDQSLTSEALDDGRLPLWNPYNFAGLPHLANPLAGVFYPPNWIHRFGSPRHVFAWLHALHLLFAGLTCFYYLRTIRLSFGAALFGAAAFEMAGWFSAHAHLVFFVHAFTWFPLLPAGLEEVFRRRLRGVFVLAVAMALIALGGFPQILVISAYFAAAYGLALAVAAWRREHFGSAFRLGSGAALAGAAGLLLAAPMLLPTFELSQSAGHRVKEVSWLMGDRLEQGALLHTALPEIFGVPDAQPDPGGGFLTSWLLARPGEPLLANNYTERSFHPGLLVLLLSLCALFGRGWRRWFFIVTIAAALAMALGTPLLRLVFPLPGIAFGSPMRWTSLTAFAMPVLAAMTIHGLATKGHGIRLVQGVSAITALLLVSVLAALWVAPDALTDASTDWLLARGVDEKIGVADKPDDEKRALLHEVLLDLRAADGPLVPVSVTAFLIALGSFFLSRLLRHAPLALALAVILMAGQQLYHHFRLHPVIDTSTVGETRSIEVEYLKQKLGDHRFLRVGPGEESSLFTPNAPLEYRLRDLQGFRALTPQSFLEFMRSVAPNPYDVGFPNLAAEDLTAPQLDFLGVKFAIAGQPLAESPWPLVFPRDASMASGFYIYENREVLPRAFLVSEIRRLDHARSMEVLRQMASNPSLAEALTDGAWVAGDAEIPERQGSVDGFEETPGRIDIALAEGTRGLCVTSTQFDTGWVARGFAGPESPDEGQLLEVLRCNHAFMGIVVPEGTRRIELRYEPRSLKIGCLAALAGLVLMLVTAGLLLAWNRSAKKKPGAEGHQYDQEQARSDREDPATPIETR